MLECSLITPLSVLREGELGQITVRTTDGELGILTGHLPLEAKLEDGSLVRLRKTSGAVSAYRLGAGSFLRFSTDRAVILSRSFTEHRDTE